MPRGAERAAGGGSDAEQKDVGALDVAVDDPQRVHVRERRRELRQQSTHLRFGQPPASAPLLTDKPREVAALAELHDNADVLLEDERVLKAHDVRRSVLGRVDRHTLECQELAVGLAPDERDRSHRALSQRTLVLVGVHRSAAPPPPLVAAAAQAVASSQPRVTNKEAEHLNSEQSARPWNPRLVDTTSTVGFTAHNISKHTL
eukprot:scaffold101736_cov80-Phaeocystis_antarctica.AAC.1